MLPWFDRVREAQIRQSEAWYPRIVRSLRDVDDLYLDSDFGVDTFLRRDGSVWQAFEPKWPNQAPTWREANNDSRVAALVLAAARLPELAELLPPRPFDALNCPSCFNQDVVLGYLVCHQCHGLGWIRAPVT